MHPITLDLAHDSRFDRLVYGRPDERDLEVFDAWLRKARALPAASGLQIRLYAASQQSINWAVQGASPTNPGSSKVPSANYVHLQTTPFLAVNKLCSVERLDSVRIYQIDIDLRRAAPDLHSLREVRKTSDIQIAGISLAQSLCIAGSARHKGPIAAHRIAVYGHWTPAAGEIIRAHLDPAPMEKALPHWPTPTHWCREYTGDTDHAPHKMAA